MPQGKGRAAVGFQLYRELQLPNEVEAMKKGGEYMLLNKTPTRPSRYISTSDNKNRREGELWRRENNPASLLGQPSNYHWGVDRTITRQSRKGTDICYPQSTILKQTKKVKL